MLKWKIGIGILVSWIGMVSIGGAQSILSSADWIEQNIAVEPVDPAEIVPAVQIADTVTESNPPQEDNIEILLPPQRSSNGISFQTVADTLRTDPEKAMKDLDYIRPILLPEEALILEIQIVYERLEYDKAEVLANGFLESFPDSPNRVLAYYYYQKSRWQLRQPLEAKPSLQAYALRQLPASYQTDLLRIFAQDASRKGDFLTATRYLIQELETPSTLQQVTPEEVLELLQTVTQAKTLHTIETRYARLSFIRREVPYYRLRLLVENNLYKEATPLAKRLVEQEQSQNRKERVAELKRLQQRIAINAKVNARRIGVILPLSSPNATIARLSAEVLEGLRLALITPPNRMEALQENQDVPEVEKQDKPIPAPPAAKVEIILRDSGLNAKNTLKAMQELVEDEHVIAIVGPLIRRTSEAAAQEAQRLQVPLISLSITSTIPDIGSYVFRNNQSWEQEMRALARYAFDYQGARQFAVIYPQTREAKNKVAYFWDEVERLGGEIRGISDFATGHQNFSQQFDSLTGINRYLSNAERRFMEKLEEEQTPIRDFDAVFAPIGTRGLRDLKVLLPYSVVYQMDTIKFLGDSGWNNYSVVSALGKAVSSPIFVDGFFQQTPQSHVQKFVRLHERYFARHVNYTGPSSYAAYAYDTLHILRTLLSDSQNKSHLQLQQALLNMSPYLGVTGVTTFLENGEAHREMKILTVEAGKIISLN